TEEQRNAILRIIKNCDSMLAIINDLLDITTIEAGKLDLHLQKIEMAKYLSDFLSEAKILAQAKDIEIILETPPDLPDVIMDPQRIEQALNNLVSNAVKFSYPGSIVKITAAKTDNSISISVQDQGQGIFESEIPLLFTDYAKGSARPTAGEKSTGLGLAIVRRILRAHDGSMDVKSKAGKGSTFTITLPIQGPKQSTTPIK
ncbi:MAG TPA: HAMP domain-containing sensor histidine kinase, partial [Candidatus Sumerlaeota bacterium]|nr:HAMP domain-containing sensor histidine kinase [Candidatus Sumerlaeota bacterium]